MLAVSLSSKLPRVARRAPLEVPIILSLVHLPTSLLNPVALVDSALVGLHPRGVELGVLVAGVVVHDDVLLLHLKLLVLPREVIVVNVVDMLLFNRLHHYTFVISCILLKCSRSHLHLVLGVLASRSDLLH